MSGTRRHRLHAPDPGRAPVRAPKRRHPPRHQAAQRDRRPRGRREGDGLRNRARGREPDDGGGRDHRHRAVPLPRAGARRPGRPDLRPLLDRDRPLRAPDRAGAVHRRVARRDRDEAPLRGSRDAVRACGPRCRTISTSSSCVPSPRNRRTGTSPQRRWTPISRPSRTAAVSRRRPPRRRRWFSQARRRATRRRRSPSSRGAEAGRRRSRPVRAGESLWPWLAGIGALLALARRRLPALRHDPGPAERGGAGRRSLRRRNPGGERAQRHPGSRSRPAGPEPAQLGRRGGARLRADADRRARRSRKKPSSRSTSPPESPR